MKKLLAVLVLLIIIVAIGAIIGWYFGKSLHDLIAYVIPISEFKNYNWFNSQEYVNLYSAVGLDRLFSFIFSVIFGAFALIFALEIITLCLNRA